MMYTYEILQEMGNTDLDVTACYFSGKEVESLGYVYIEEWENPTLFQPTKKVFMADIMVKKALAHNAVNYARNLSRVVFEDDEWSEGLTFEGIADLLNASLRQVTIASMITIQGEGTQ